MYGDITGATATNKQDALKFLTEEALVFFRRFHMAGENIGLPELDALKAMRSKLASAVIIAEQLIITATLDGLGLPNRTAGQTPQTFSQIRKHLIAIRELTAGLLTVPDAEHNVLRIRKLLVKIKYLLPREQIDYENFAKLLKKVEAQMANTPETVAEIIRTQQDFALLAFLGNNLFGEELAGESVSDKQIAAYKAKLLPQFIGVMGLLIGRLNDLQEKLQGQVYSDKENQIVALAYEAMSSALKKVAII